MNDDTMMLEQIHKVGPADSLLSLCHNIQPDVPVENILAVYEHAKTYIPSFAKGD